ncbi:DNA-binding protein [Candidatus Collierbacteria bacterium CG10_big_fil_rev_8_21_14_0_10_44_9]|uniref:DNA-binding protein n=1 Tax=Candidatus Collierbacteria bacterium CG10_big_fil_rev_8_21_14_0_10_44_9 TaxID=1974535 RepID=A0A2H0VIY5_9BACT|nr:MAG: DNA-binding protein [Candidatus Collierbacteria bacterium CG10_big_fil_rev_8_21_14_0_10_44_9]
MDKDNAIKYWLESAGHDQETAESLFVSKQYSWCLFIWQLVLEKHLKAIIVTKLDKSAPTSHDLVYLANFAGLSLSKTQEKNLSEITSFNIKARYEDYKHAFYKKATLSYSIKWIKIIKDILIWLQKQN